MKKLICIIISSVILLALAGCGAGASGASKTADTTIDIGESEIFTEADRQAAVKLILDEVGGWESVEKVYSIRYTDDERSKEEGGYKDYDEVMVFVSDLHSVKSSSKAGGFNTDEDYTDWQWLVGKGADGQYELLTWGYG